MAVELSSDWPLLSALYLVAGSAIWVGASCLVFVELSAVRGMGRVATDKLAHDWAHILRGEKVTRGERAIYAWKWARLKAREWGTLLIGFSYFYLVAEHLGWIR